MAAQKAAFFVLKTDIFVPPDILFYFDLFHIVIIWYICDKID